MSIEQALALRVLGHHIMEWLHDFTTGAPMAGLFALAAALIAFRGIKNTIAATDKATAVSKEAIDANRESNAMTNATTQQANEAIAKKNAQDQWWSTLKWAYSEAKSFKATGDEAETRAVTAVLEALNNEEDLSDLQSTTVNEVSKLFKNVADDDVQATVDRIQTVTGHHLGKAYMKDVGLALSRLEPQYFVLRFPETNVKSGPGSRPDFVVRTPSGQVIAIETFAGGNARKDLDDGLLQDWYRHIGVSVLRPKWTMSSPDDAKITRLLVLERETKTSPLPATLRWIMDHLSDTRVAPWSSQNGPPLEALLDELAALPDKPRTTSPNDPKTKGHFE